MESNDYIEQLLNLEGQLTAIHTVQLKERLALYLNHLLLNDFNKLIQILYRVDVNERKLKELLQNNQQTDAALIIAELLLERQEEKRRTREALKSNEDISDEDKW